MKYFLSFKGKEGLSKQSFHFIFCDFHTLNIALLIGVSAILSVRRNTNFHLPCNHSKILVFHLSWVLSNMYLIRFHWFHKNSYSRHWRYSKSWFDTEITRTCCLSNCEVLKNNMHLKMKWQCQLPIARCVIEKDVCSSLFESEICWKKDLKA